MQRFLALAFGLAFVAVVIRVATLDSAPPKPAAPQTPEDIRANFEWAAIGGCEIWTRANSKLGVGKIVGRYTLLEKNGNYRPDQVRAEVDYRAEGSGLLMRSICKYQRAGTDIMLLAADSRPQ
jgi:hypothetical protein